MQDVIGEAWSLGGLAQVRETEGRLPEAISAWQAAIEKIHPVTQASPASGLWCEAYDYAHLGRCDARSGQNAEAEKAFALAEERGKYCNN